MIQLKQKELSSQAIAKLKEYQEEIDTLNNFPEQVEKAKTLFSLKNYKGNRTFDEVKKTLTEMCSGAKRCCYCEHSTADEVEHIYPKTIFPEKTFVWENYLYACGPCNGRKYNNFAVFRFDIGEFKDITPPRRDSEYIPTPPAKGDAVFINPREENPLDYLWLDISKTFRFVENVEEQTKEYERAKYTIKILDLNRRDDLIEERKLAFKHYLYGLHYYKERKNSKADKAELDEIRKGFQKEGHPTVWAEMKRQYELHPELTGLFNDIPEALEW